MEPNNETKESGEVKLKNVAIFGFAFAIIKYDGIGADLFRNHKVTISCLQYFMMVAVSASTAVKLHQDLLPEWATLALSRVSIFCVFQAFFMLQAIILFEETPRDWFVLCIFPIVFLLIPLKQLKERDWFRLIAWETITLAFEYLRRWVQNLWRIVTRAFSERPPNLNSGRDKCANQAALPVEHLNQADVTV